MEIKKQFSWKLLKTDIKNFVLIEWQQKNFFAIKKLK